MWTKEAIELLKKRLEEGASYRQIGNELGCSSSAVAGKVSRLRIVRGPSAAARRDLQAKMKREAARVRTAKLEEAQLVEPRAPDVAHQKALTTMSVEAAVRDPDDLIPLLELQAQHCRYPVGEPRDALFCGQPKVEGVSYCAFHARKCFLPIKLARRHVDAAARAEEHRERADA